MKKEAVLEKLNSTVEGLSQKEANLRLKRYGKNLVKELYKISPIKIFFKQFKSFLIYILLFAAIFSLIIKHYIDAGVIFAIVLLNASLGFYQQYKAEKSIMKLKKILTPIAKVFRNGKLTKIKSEEIVPGDILKLEEGDKIIADCRVFSTNNLEVNEAILTGESAPIEKFPDKISGKIILAERKNMLYSGTTVVKGSCKAVVVATGMSTEFGKIAKMLQQISLPETPMQKKLDKFAKQISFIIIFLAFLTFIFGIYRGTDTIQGWLLTAIALAVSAIPEGLPAIITISLAFAINIMSQKNVVIRRLPAAETLGSVTVICSDKTGTITEEKMTAREIFSNNKLLIKQNSILKFKNKKIDIEKEKELYQLLKTSILCNNARFEEKEKEKGYITIGDPTESALVLAALDLGVNKKILSEKEPRVKEISFTSTRKMMSIIRKSERRKILYSKGASNVILSKASSEFLNGTTVKLSPKRKEELRKRAERLEGRGHRVLAFAFKILKGRDMKEESLIFLGFIALLDPPRPEVKEAIKACKNAGIKVKMITGDSPLTAAAIASEIGITGKLVTGRKLEDMSDHELKDQIDKIGIFARTDPQQKLRIVQILKIKNEEIAITGDGINDVLALKKADIGVAMGQRGSDVAREISDMVLIDDNFASIVKAVEEGRVVYDNSKKATKFLLASNFDEILLIGYSIFQGFKLPLLPLQILWINLITDSFPALALTKEKGENVMKGKPRKEKSILNGIFWFIIFASIIAFIAELFIYHYALNNLSEQKMRTMMMMTIIGFEVFFAFTCRSNKTLREVGLFSNKWLIYAILIMVVLQIVLIYTPLAPLFGVATLSLKEWGYVLLASLPGFVIFEIWKIFRKKQSK